MREPIRKSPRKPKPISFFHEEQANMEQHLKSPSKRQSSPSKKSPKKSPPKNAVKKQLTGKFKYRTLVSKAMMAMGRNSAHSLPAILKYIQSNYQIDRDEATIKRFVKSTLNVGPFTKIGGSYKLRPEKSAPRKKTPAQKKKQPESEEEEEEDEEEEKEEVKKSPRKRKAAEDKKPEEEQSEKKKRSPRKKKEESKEDEEPKKKRSPRKKKEEKEDDEEPKKKRTPKKKKEEEKEEDENGNNSNNNNNKRKKTPKKSAPIKDKELIVPDVLPDVTTSGIVFNTTDLPEVRADIKQTIDSLLTDDNVRVGIVANRGWKDAAYNLELLEFTDDSKKIQDFVENSFGEGRDWLSYYKQVMQDCLNFGWGVNKTKTLVLIGDEGVNAVRDPSLQAEIGKLTQLGGKVCE